MVLRGMVAGDVEVLRSAMASAEAAGCSHAELKEAKLKLKALQHVVVCGTTGILDKYINGSYLCTNEKVNGKPVFSMIGDPTKCLFMATDTKWYAAPVIRKDANERGGWAHTEAGLAHPALAQKWVV